MKKFHCRFKDVSGTRVRLIIFAEDAKSAEKKARDQDWINPWQPVDVQEV